MVKDEEKDGKSLSWPTGKHQASYYRKFQAIFPLQVEFIMKYTGNKKYCLKLGEYLYQLSATLAV